MPTNQDTQLKLKVPIVCSNFSQVTWFSYALLRKFTRNKFGQSKLNEGGGGLLPVFQWNSDQNRCGSDNACTNELISKQMWFRYCRQQWADIKSGRGQNQHMGWRSHACLIFLKGRYVLGLIRLQTTPGLGDKILTYFLLSNLQATMVTTVSTWNCAHDTGITLFNLRLKSAVHVDITFFSPFGTDV